MNKLLLVLVVISWSCHNTREDNNRKILDSTKKEDSSVLMTKSAVKVFEVKFKLKYKIRLPRQYFRTPEPGEYEEYPRLFNVNGDTLSICNPIYDSGSPNYFTYLVSDSATLLSKRFAYEISDYHYHINLDNTLLASLNRSDRVFKQGDAYFFKFPSGIDSLYFWILFDNERKNIKLYRFSQRNSQSIPLGTFSCYSNGFREYSIINASDFRMANNTIIFSNPITDAYFYYNCLSGNNRCGEIPDYASYLVGITREGNLILRDHFENQIFLADSSGKKLKEVHYSIDGDPEFKYFIFDSLTSELLLSSFNWENFELSVFSVQI